MASQCSAPAVVMDSIDGMVDRLAGESGPAHILIMSNGGFGGLHGKLVQRLV